jgi:hypothetical protein
MKTIQKAIKFLDKHGIEYEYEKDDIMEHIRIWTACNSYYWITLHLIGENRRTVITEETFDIECYKPNGDAYMGDITHRISFESLKKKLESE